MPLTDRIHGSDCVTEGIRVQVIPEFLREQSDTEAGRYLFTYRIRVTNQSDQLVQLLRREWTIVDADGDRRMVNGDGVVGRQPTLEPGATFEYTSYCPLPTRWGTMEGTYIFAVLDGNEGQILAKSADGELVPTKENQSLAHSILAEPAEIPVQIARFFLVAPPQ